MPAFAAAMVVHDLDKALTQITPQTPAPSD